MKVNGNIHNLFGFQMWNDEQIYELHRASLEILERTGVLVHDEEGLQLLKDGGAFVDGNRVRIPAHMVEDAIASAPSKITLCSPVDGKRKLHLYRNNIYYGLGTDLPAFTDPYTDEMRDTVLSDIENVAKVTEVCENIDFVANMGVTSDENLELSDLLSFKAVRKYCDKPNWITGVDYGNLKALIDMAAVQAGGYEALRNNPTIGVYNEPISPLENTKESVQKVLLCAEYGIPMTYSSGIMAGATGPVTLAGTIALGNAEGLAGLVFHQLKRRGAPFILGLAGSIMDMKTTISCYGGPEQEMIHTVVGQLGRFYDLPTFGIGGCTDACDIDAQAGMEAMYSNFVAALSGTNLVHDNGYTAAGAVGNLGMIMLDDEIVGFIKHFMKGIEISDETLALDLIHEVGPANNFMASEHTIKYMKKEAFYPEFMNRVTFDAWDTAGKPSVKGKINKKVREIIEAETPVMISDDLIKKFDDITANREKEIADGKRNKEDF